MDVLLRLLAVIVLLIPVFTGGCVEVLDPGEREMHGEGDAGTDAGTDVGWTAAEEDDWGFDDGVLDEMVDEDADSEQDEDNLEESVDEEDDDVREEQTVTSEDIDRGGPLYVDEDAPDVGIRRIRRREGNESHYLQVRCNDDGVRPSWRRTSRRCDVDLASAVRAISIEPAVNFRIAPTRRGFRILGDFEKGEYDVEIGAGLRTDQGSYLKDSSTRTVTIPELSPSLSFTAQGRYLPRTAWKELTFRHRNVDEVDLDVRHVPKENLSFWISSNSENADRRTSNQVVDATLQVPNERDEALTSSVSIDDYLDDPEPGLYQIRVRGDGEKATTRLQVTDINLLAKRHEPAPGKPWEEHIDVWAVEMESTESIPGVVIKAIRPSGATMARCRTNMIGHCRLDLPQDTVDRSPPMALIAHKGPDLTYLKFDDVSIEGGVEQIDGPAYREQRSYLATLYGDRDLYRPGDEFHLVGALREEDYRAVDAGIPVELTIRDPEGKTVLERTKSTDHLGTFDLSHTLSEVAPTGRWEAELEVGTRTLETYSFHVEEFVPERLDVSARAATPTFMAGDDATFEISARYLFGASAVGSEVTLDCRLVPIESTANDGSDYTYGPVEIEESRSVIDLPTTTGVIDEEDRAEVSCGPLEQRIGGPMRVEATVAVAEGGSGRVTHASADATMQPSALEIGLRTDVDDLRAGDTFEVEGRLVDIDGELTTGDDESVTLEFYNVRRHRSWRRSRGRHRVHYDYELILERAIDAEVDEGRFSARTTAASVRHAYLVRARLGDARTDLQIDRRGRYWRWSSRRGGTPRARKPSEVTIETPDEAALNRPTEIEFTAPFGGRVLMTVETDEVMEMEWIDAEEGHNRWSFTIDTDEPNVYVGAMILRNPRDVDPDAFTPERAFGAVSIPVDRAAVQTEVGLGVPEEVRPGESLTIEVDTGLRGGQSMATVAAVDEGILQLTNYDTPDPLDAMWESRRLGVETFDTVGWATQLPPMDPTSRTGGGRGPQAEEEASEGRILPFRPVALWSGPVEVGDDGRAVVEFDVPNYRGRLRVMTAVFGADKMGAAERDVLVRDPLTVQTTFPRHLTNEDEAQIPVFLTNLTDTIQQVSVEIGAEAYDLPGFSLAANGSGLPVLEFPDGASRQIELDPDESTTLYFSARARRSGGAAAVTVEATSAEHYSVDEAKIPFRHRGPSERRLELVSLEEGTTDLSQYLDGWVPTTEETTFFASALPDPGAFDHLENLVRYPHGCAEQTLSRVRPMVFIPDLVESLDPVTVSEQDGIHAMVESGISRILSMQTSSGGFAYWPGRTRPSRPWVTAHALDFLMDAQNRGYDVPQQRIDDAVEWLVSNRSSSRREAYQHYVLAQAGEPQTQSIREAIEDLPDEPTGSDREDAYLLKAALYLAGDRSFADDLRAPQVDTSEEDGRSSRWGFYSHRRQRAMMLGVYLELFGRNEEIVPLVDAVTRDLTNGGRRGLNTQEMAWALMGLGQWYDLDNADDVEIALEIDGRALDQHLSSSHSSWAVRRASEFDNISATLESGDYDGQLSMMVRSRGVREEPTEQSGGDGLEVERTYLDARGEELSGDQISPGQVIYARVRLENTTGERLRQLALVDRLPAGLEFENPELGAAELPSWADDEWDTDHINVRDDRVEMYGGLSRGDEVEMVYPVRATIAGDYYAAPVEVEAMYEPEIWARGEAGEVHIGAPASQLVD